MDGDGGEGGRRRVNYWRFKRGMRFQVGRSNISLYFKEGYRNAPQSLVFDGGGNIVKQITIIRTGKVWYVLGV